MNLWPRIRYLAVAASAALCACSPIDLLNATVPNEGYAITKDIAYGDAPRQALDIYLPDEQTALPKPVIVFFYGGRWQHGSKDMYKFAGQAFASKGYVTVIADYRLYPEVAFPAFLEDGASALVWTHQHIADYGGDPAKIVVAGHSAGAYIALMLSLNPRYIQAAGGGPSWIKAAIGLAGPYNFIPFTESDLIAIFGSANDPNTQPITFVHPQSPPALLLAGDADTEVKLHNTPDLAAKLRQYHNPVEEHMYPDVGHIGIVLALARGFRGKAPVLADIDRFVRATIEPASLSQ